MNTLIAEVVAALVTSVPVGPGVHHEHSILRTSLVVRVRIIRH